MRIGIVDLDTSHPQNWIPLERELGHDVVGIWDGGAVHPREIPDGRFCEDPHDRAAPADEASGTCPTRRRAADRVEAHRGRAGRMAGASRPWLLYPRRPECAGRTDHLECPAPSLPRVRCAHRGDGQFAGLPDWRRPAALEGVGIVPHKVLISRWTKLLS